MRKLWILLIFIVFLFVSCQKLENSKKKDLNPILDKIEQIYPSRFYMTENKNIVCGLFNEGKKVIFLSDEGSLLPFKDGYTIFFKKGGNLTVIDEKGNKRFSYSTGEVWEFCYDEGYFESYFEGEGTKVYNSEGNVVDIHGFPPVINNIVRTVNPEISDKMCFYNLEGYYLKNKQGNIFYEDYCEPFYNGYAIVEDSIKKMYGLINLQTEYVLPKKFKYLDSLEYGRIVASKKNDRYGLGLSPAYGLVDLNGNWIIEPKFYDIRQCSERYVAVQIKAKNSSSDFVSGWKIVNIDNNEETDLRDDIELKVNNIQTKIFYDGVAIFAQTKDENSYKYGLVNQYGQIVLQAGCDLIEDSPDNGYWRIQKSGKYMLFKENEGILDPQTYLDFTSVK